MIIMKNAIISDLEQRYTAKRYDSSKHIPEDELETIYRAIQLSPSSINSQPWKFIVIESNAAKERLHNTFIKKHQFNQKHIKEASHIILFAYNPRYTRDDYAKVVDQGIADGRIAPENKEQAFSGFSFAELNTLDNGDTSAWTKAQTYLALGNTLHVLARLGIDSTTMEGVDTELISEEFQQELGGYQCDVALAMGYHLPDEDYNAQLPKSRLPLNAILTVL